MAEEKGGLSREGNPAGSDCSSTGDARIPPDPGLRWRLEPPVRPLRDTDVEWRREFDLRRQEESAKPPELVIPDRPLYAPDWVPADQPTSEDENQYYWKMRL